ncbi:MAG: exodeoxyribonuclease III [Halanaerobiales bacterium]|nr:exodeoxyribonuclease III [Halanaerobiales bacterium]
MKYRMRWENDFRSYVCGLDQKKSVIICGDMNCAHTEKDVKNDKSNTRSTGFTQEEQKNMTEINFSVFTDYFRYFDPDKTDAYAWWSLTPGVRERNVGWRIDYFLDSSRLTDRVTSTPLYFDIYGSDHCSVGLEVEI